ncbi:MAG: winged helix-turn-helix domain-containing protein [Saccharospirillum sp.]
MFILKGVLRAESQEKILIYLLLRNTGYGKQIADFFKSPVNPIQKQLARLEEDGVIAGESVGKTRVYSLNPRYPFLQPLKALLKAAIAAYPPKLINELAIQRTRPRQPGKLLNRLQENITDGTEQ